MCRDMCLAQSTFNSRNVLPVVYYTVAGSILSFWCRRIFAAGFFHSIFPYSMFSKILTKCCEFPEYSSTQTPLQVLHPTIAKKPNSCSNPYITQDTLSLVRALPHPHLSSPRPSFDPPVLAFRIFLHTHPLKNAMSFSSSAPPCLTKKTSISPTR